MDSGSCFGKEAPCCCTTQLKIHRCSRFRRTKREVNLQLGDPNGKCWTIMDNAGIDSAYFPFATAHRLESNELKVLP